MRQLWVITFTCLLFIQCKETKTEKIEKIKVLLDEINTAETTPVIATEEPEMKFDTEEKNIFLKYTSTNIDSTTIHVIKDGESMSEAEFAKMIKPSTNESQYIYFYKEDFDNLFSNDNGCQEQKGIRIYLVKYPDNYKSFADATKSHLYAGKNTVVLRAMCGSTAINTTTYPNALYNFGDVCPPNCDNIYTKGERTTLQVKDGEYPKK